VRVLVVEDEVHLADGIRKGLEADGFAVDVAHDGTDGLWRAREHDYDAIILDIMLPGVNGYRVCATLRAEENWTPVLMLTAKEGDLDEAEALDTGADDYLTKPFAHVVLVARLRALVRRGRPARRRPARPGLPGRELIDRPRRRRRRPRGLTTDRLPAAFDPPESERWRVRAGRGARRCRPCGRRRRSHR
jgi:DNA-binding response OmpR family regulator